MKRKHTESIAIIQSPSKIVCKIKTSSVQGAEDFPEQEPKVGSSKTISLTVPSYIN